MIVNPDMDVHTKIRNHRKTQKNSKLVETKTLLNTEI